MSQQTPVLEGIMYSGGQKSSVAVRYASKHSLWIELKNDPTGNTVDNLELRVGNGPIQIGPCMLLDDPDTDGPARRLVPVDRIFDFKKLFFRSEVVTLEIAATNMAFELGYKEKIDAEFKVYVSGLTYDLSVYANMLDQLDSETNEEPDYVREHVREKMLSNVGPVLDAYLEETLARLERIVAGFSEKEHEHHGYYFRRQMWHLLLRAPIMARTNLKPRGYSGDSEMMRMVYANDYRGDSTLGKILHRFSIRQAAAQAVRNRRMEIPKMIRRAITEPGVISDERFRVLSVACGPAVEIGDLLVTIEDSRRFHFSLLDQDQHALLEAGSLIREKEEILKSPISSDLIRESVRTMLITGQLKERWGLFHFIYSMGLFDYLTTPVAGAVLGKLYQLLKPHGEMVIGNMHSLNSSRYFMAYWHDWKIIHRTEEEFTDLAKDLPGAETRLTFDDTRIQMMLCIRKRA